ncbi:Putative LOC409606, partial [Caligus rogercresseyi]
KSNASDRCGFFRINGESVVPYTVTGGIKYVPLFYFEGETDHLKLKSDEVSGWDLAYLKFCCKVQGIRNELFASEVCRVVALDEIRGHFPSGTTFEDYWPAKGSIEPVNAQRVPAGNWTQKPPLAPPTPQQQQANSQQQPGQQQQVVGQQPKGSSNAGVPPNGASIMSPNYAAAHAAARSAYESQLAANHHFQQFIRAAAANSSLSSLQRNHMNQILRSSTPNVAPSPVLGVPCINVRPQIYQDLMMTLPDF